MEIEAGRILSERYRLIRPIGHGAQGSVWVAEHLALSTNIAVKLIDPELAKKESARDRFRREATAAAQLRSAHVVQILDHGIDDDQPFIVMELLDGEDLFERLAHRGRLSLREVSKIVTQVARALIRAHQAEIVHRDLKPENVFLVPNEDDEIVKVLDFGVAKVNSPDKSTMQRTGIGTLIGTPHYMSPEQVKGISEVDFRTDLWALGVITYQCVTGELPFDSQGVGDLLIRITLGEAPVPSKVLPSLPASFDAWFARACDRDPAKRFQGAKEMALALAAVVSAIVEVPRVGTVRPPGKKSVAPSKSASTRPAPASSGTPLLEVPPAPRAMRPLLIADEAIDSIEFEEVAEPDLVAREIFDSTDIDFDDEPEPNGRFSHFEFPLLVRAGTSQQKANAAALLDPAPAKAEPADANAQPPADAAATSPAAQELLPPPPADALTAAPADESSAAAASAEAPSGKDEAAGADAHRSSSQPPSVVEAQAAELPSPSNPPAAEPPQPGDATEARTSSPKVPASARRSTVSGLARSGLLSIPPPPELDGSKRRRMVRFLVAGLVLGAVFVAWSVVRSQLRAVPAAVPQETVPSAAPPPPPPPSTTTESSRPSATTTATAVDPGKVSRPTKTTPSTKGRPRRSPKKAPAGEIEIPNGPDEGVPPAP